MSNKIRLFFLIFLQEKGGKRKGAARPFPYYIIKRDKAARKARLPRGRSIRKAVQSSLIPPTPMRLPLSLPKSRISLPRKEKWMGWFTA